MPRELVVSCRLRIQADVVSDCSDPCFEARCLLSTCCQCAELTLLLGLSAGQSRGVGTHREQA